MLEEQLLAFARDLNRIHQRERQRTLELESALEELEESYIATVRMLAFVVEAKDAHTRSHLDRAHDYAVALASRVAPGLIEKGALRYGFLLHDVGKVAIPEAILGKQGPLTPHEREVMQAHPLIGAQIVSPVKFLRPAVPIIEAHHERWDGAGYPRGLKGEQIPLEARIFSIADAFDAMTSDRPYRRALSSEEAIERIARGAGTQFDAELIGGFVAMCEDRLGHGAIFAGKGARNAS